MIQNIDFIDKNIKKDSLIVNPINKVSLEPIKESFEMGIIEPLLIGNKDIIAALLDDLNWHLQPKIINSSSEEDSSSEESSEDDSSFFKISTDDLLSFTSMEVISWEEDVSESMKVFFILLCLTFKDI